MFDRLFAHPPDGHPEARPPGERQAAVAGSRAAHEASLLLRAPTALVQLSEDEALAVVSFMTPRRFSAGTVLIREGESNASGFMVLILDGEVTVERLRTRHENGVTLSVLGRGSLIGEMALVDGEARSATCTASTDVSCAVLTREALEKLIAEQPSTGAKLMTAIAVRLAERLREVSRKLHVTTKLVITLQQEIDALMPTPDKRVK